MCLFNVGSEWTCAYRVRSNGLCGGACFSLAVYDDSNSVSELWPAGYLQKKKKEKEGGMNQWTGAAVDGREYLRKKNGLLVWIEGRVVWHEDWKQCQF